MKIQITTAIALAAVFVFTACTGKKASGDAQNANDDVKRLVLYYSQEGTTRAVAEQLQRELGADIEAIEVEDPYTGTYDETIARVQKEREQGITPKIKPLKHNLKDYDEVFLGYPIWFGTYAPPVAALLETADFGDAKVVPFCSFGSGGLESSMADLKAKLPNTVIADGYGVRTARIDKMPTELHRFLIDNGYIAGEVKKLPAFSDQQPVTAQETEIFKAATDGYKYPPGTAVSCGKRDVEGGVEYKFIAEGTAPDGSVARSTVYVLAPHGDDAKPEFTKIVR